MIIRFFLALICTVSAGAHEGHDHNAPAALKPQHGGIVKGNEAYFIEAARDPKRLDVYIYSSAGDLKAPKALAPSSVKLAVTVELPRKKPIPLKLTPEVDHFSAPFESNDAHRVTVLVKIEGEHGDTLKYTFEKNK